MLNLVKYHSRFFRTQCKYVPHVRSVGYCKENIRIAEEKRNLRFAFCGREARYGTTQVVQSFSSSVFATPNDSFPGLIPLLTERLSDPTSMNVISLEYLLTRYFVQLENAEFLEHLLDTMGKDGKFNMELKERLQKIRERLKTLQQRWDNCKNAADEGNLQEFVRWIRESDYIFAELEEILKSLNKTLIAAIAQITRTDRQANKDSDRYLGFSIASIAAAVGSVMYGAYILCSLCCIGYFGFYYKMMEHDETANSLGKKLDILKDMKVHIEKLNSHVLIKRVSLAELQKIKNQADFEELELEQKEFEKLWKSMKAISYCEIG